MTAASSDHIKLSAFLITLFACLFAIGLSAAFADESTRDFLNGVELYNEGDYDAAVQNLLKVAESGIQNGKLFYNLGNAYFKAGDIGRAMLWYERALKLIPNDPDLRFNHDYVMTRLKDERVEKESPVFRILFFWKHVLSPLQIQWAGIILNCLFWGILAVRLVLKKRRILGVEGVLALVLSLVFILTSVYTCYENKFQQKAIIVSDEVSIRSGLSDDSTELFVLHAGTRVLVRKTSKDYYRIRFSEDKIGWVKAEDAEII